MIVEPTIPVSELPAEASNDSDPPGMGNSDHADGHQPPDAPESVDAGREPPEPPEAPPETPDDEPKPEKKPKKEPARTKSWYVVKVQSGREESIKDAIERRVKIEGLEEYFGQVIIPVERVAEMRNGKRVVREKKLYPGYLMVEVEFNDRILYLFRETSGVGDFVGGGLNRPPLPMSAREVERMLGPRGDVPTKDITKPKYDRGDRVKVREGTFAGMEGEVKELLEAKNLVRVELTIFGRPVPVELEYWQVEVL
jgi:transcription termination/antitermination protein NusG